MVKLTNPYPGLRPFDESEAALFFGRDDFTANLLAAVESHYLVALVGASGSGKTSVLKAGLLPALRRRYPESRVAILRPTERPLLALATSLAKASTDANQSDIHARADRIYRELEGKRTDLSNLLQGIGFESSTFIIIDQFEELFTLSEESESNALVEILLSATSSPELHSVIAIRSDFVSRLIEHPQLAKALSSSTLFLGGLTEEELRRSIEEPAHLAGVSLEEGLVERMVRDVGNQPGNLPALQTVLHGLSLEHPEHHTITHEAYAFLGGAPGVLAHWCEEFWASLSSPEQRRIKPLLLRLVTPAQTRRAVSIDEFSVKERSLIDRMLQERLVVVSGVGSDVFVEFAHDAIVRSWVRLRDWMEEEKEPLSWRDRLSSFAGAWKKSGASNEFLIGGTLLKDALDHIKKSPDAFSEFELSYVEKSLQYKQRIDSRAREAKIVDDAHKPMVFISYAHEDENSVLGLYHALKKEGVRPWIDKEEIRIGQEWDRVIRDAIRKADFIIVCISKKSTTKRGYIQREIRLALDLYNEMPFGEVLLMPVRLEQCDVPEELARHQYADLFRSDGFERLIRSILVEWDSRISSSGEGAGPGNA